MGKAKAKSADNVNIDGSDELPEGWVAPKLIDLFEVKYGKGLRESDRRPGDVDVYGSNGVVGKHNKAITSGETVVLGRKGTVGALNFSTVPCWPIDTTYFIDEFVACDSQYVFYALRTLGLEAMDTSTAIPGLNRNDIYDCKFPLPPLAEQKRIVAKVEALLARVNKAREHLARVPEILKKFRQSVLAAACSGRLTADWREENGVAFSDWSMDEIGGLYKVTTGGTPSRRQPEYFRNGTIPWVKTGEVQNGDIYSAQESITVAALDNSSAKVFPKGTLLVALYGEGKTRGQVGRLMIDAATNQACAALVNPSIRPETNMYVFYYLLGQYYQFREKSMGGNQPNLSVGLIRSWSVRIPPLAEQIEIVNSVKRLLNFSVTLEERIKSVSKGTSLITQSVLSKAFSGELVETEAELARREGRDYEPASVLLERIGGERVAGADGGKPQNSGEKKRTRNFKKSAQH